MAYTIEFAASVREQLKSLTVRQRAAIFDGIASQLIHQPLLATKNRKLLRPNPIAPWELRIGNLRVFYEVTTDEPDIVKILAVGLKNGNQLFIADREITL